MSSSDLIRRDAEYDRTREFQADDLDLDLGVGAAALMAEVDHRVAEIMEGWEL